MKSPIGLYKAYAQHVTVFNVSAAQRQTQQCAIMREGLSS